MEEEISSLSARRISDGSREDRDGARVGTMTRISSGSNLTNMEKRIDAMTVSRVNALRASVDRHCDTLSRSLLTGKESAEKRSMIEGAFRGCRDAFLEVSIVLVNLLEERANGSKTDNFKMIIEDVLKKNIGDVYTLQEGGKICKGIQKSYASVASTSRPKVNLSRGPSVEVPDSTSFFVIPDERGEGRYKTSQETKEALFRVLKPAQCALKVNKIAYAPKNGIRIEATMPDLDRIKNISNLGKVGLKIQESVKANPRLIIHGVPADMNKVEIKEELIAQNLGGVHDEVKVVYLYPPRQSKQTTSCVLEVSPMIRNELMKNGKIYLRYSACTFADYIRVLQCYKCSAFGHVAGECRSAPLCGLCAGSHEKRDCTQKSGELKCCNCMRARGRDADALDHSATDVSRCPILGKKIKDKIAYINYE